MALSRYQIYDYLKIRGRQLYLYKICSCKIQLTTANFEPNVLPTLWQFESLLFSEWHHHLLSCEVHYGLVWWQWGETTGLACQEFRLLDWEKTSGMSWIIKLKCVLINHQKSVKKHTCLPNWAGKNTTAHHLNTCAKHALEVVMWAGNIPNGKEF